MMKTDFQELWSQCELQKSVLEEKNRQIEALLECSPAGILLLDHNERVLKANGALRTMLGAGQIPLEGMPVAECSEILTYGLGPPPARQILKDALLGKVTRAEISFGILEPRTLLVGQTTVKDATGQRIGTVVFLQDISESLRMRREAEELCQLAEANPCPVVRLRSDGRFSYANPACQSFFEKIGIGEDSLEQLLPADYIEFVQRVLETKTTIRDVKVERMGHTLELTFGPPIGHDEVLLMLVDITDKQRTQALLRKHTEELEAAYGELRRTQAQLIQSEKMALLGTLAAGIAHEINTPAGTIGSGTHTLVLACRKLSNISEKLASRMDQEVKNEIVSLLQVMEEISRAISMASARIAKIVRSLKSFARIDEAFVKSVDLREGLESTLTLLHNKLKNKVDVVREYGQLPPVECLPSQINQVFMNLLLNAIEAIPDKGTIRIRTESEGVTVRVSISDTGRGIPSEKLDRLFDPSFSNEGPRSRAGLGLSICHKIVHDHRGQILVDSKPGRGSIFTLVLPTTFAGTVQSG